MHIFPGRLPVSLPGIYNKSYFLGDHFSYLVRVIPEGAKDVLCH
jgi:hypothetical protein